MHGR